MTGSIPKPGLTSAAGFNPGVRSDSGFKAPSEDLAEIIETDKQTRADLGITRQQMLDAMKQASATIADSKATRLDASALLLQGLCKDRTPPEELLELVRQYPDLEYGQMVYWRLDKFVVGSRLYLGTQLCPFGCGTATPKDFFVLNQETSHSMFYSGLMPHLIGAHNFCEGHVIYRMDPIHSALVFGLPTRYAVAELNQMWQEKLARLSESPDPVIRDFAQYHLNGNYLEQVHERLNINSVAPKPSALEKKVMKQYFDQKEKRQRQKPTST